MKIFILKSLIFYKRYISKGNYCRFVPSCSEYMYEAVVKYGVTKGIFLGIRRILKCGFWHKSGVDLVK